MKKLYTSVLLFADWLGCSRERVKLYCEENGLPHLKYKHSAKAPAAYLIPVDAAMAWAEKHKFMIQRISTRTKRIDEIAILEAKKRKKVGRPRLTNEEKIERFKKKLNKTEKK